MGILWAHTGAIGCIGLNIVRNGQVKRERAKIRDSIKKNCFVKINTAYVTHAA